MLTVLMVLAGGPAACSSGPKGSAGPFPSASIDVQRILEIGRRFAQCARDHGYPGFADPQFNGDRLEYPATDPGLKDQLAEIAKIPECKALSDQLPGARSSPPPIPSAADLAKLNEFAKCVREHGIPDWPDPKADGTFPISGTPLENEGNSERFMAAVDACRQHYDRRVVTS